MIDDQRQACAEAAGHYAAREVAPEAEIHGGCQARSWRK
jgi:hypothetical protein